MSQVSDTALWEVQGLPQLRPHSGPAPDSDLLLCSNSRLVLLLLKEKIRKWILM